MTIENTTLFLTIFDLCSSVVKSVCDCHLSGAILVANDFETLITGYAIIPGQVSDNPWGYRSYLGPNKILLIYGFDRINDSVCLLKTYA